MQKILIVEDNEEQLKTLHDSIREKYPDWKIQIAKNYKTAMELLAASLQVEDLQIPVGRSYQKIIENL